MVTSADALVIGAGAVGASCAFHLAQAGLRTVVVDQFGGPAEGSTGRCFASVRAQWADDLNIELSWRSIQAFRSFPEEHGVDVGYRERVPVRRPPEAWPAHLAAVERQRGSRRPCRRPGRQRRGRDHPVRAGRPGRCHLGARRRRGRPARSDRGLLGARPGSRSRYHVPATGHVAGPGRGGWVVRAGSEDFAAGLVVNAAGGWAGQVAALAGLEVPVSHSRRNIYASAPGAFGRPLPMTIDLATGVYLRSEGDAAAVRRRRRPPESAATPRRSTGRGWRRYCAAGCRAFRGWPTLPWTAAACVGRHLRDVPGQPGHPRPAPGRPGVVQRLRVLRPRIHAGPRDRPAGGRGSGRSARSPAWT